MFTSKLGAASGDLKVAYEDALSQLPPTIKGKDWGFSVNQHNQIVILEGSDKLSDTEQEIILSVFAKASVGQAAGAVADIVERMLELERMPKGVSNGFGRFDVSRTNFHEVVDLRTYLNSHGPGGPYGQHRVDPFDYAGLFFTGGYAMMEQISAKAEETYINKSLR